MNLPYLLILSKDAQAVSIIRHRKDIPIPLIEAKNRMKQLARHTSFEENPDLYWRKQNARLHSNYVLDTSIPLAGPTADRTCSSWVHLSTEEVRPKTTGSESQNANTERVMCQDPKIPRWARRAQGKSVEKTIFYDLI